MRKILRLDHMVYGGHRSVAGLIPLRSIQMELSKFGGPFGAQPTYKKSAKQTVIAIARLLAGYRDQEQILLGERVQDMISVNARHQRLAKRRFELP